MNSKVRSAYSSALLADAAYVEGLRPFDQGILLELKLVDALTRPLAKHIGSQFRVISQWTDPAGSGFSVTVFADSSGGQHIAFRGTERRSLADWVTDLDAYLASGVARRQVIAMVNWYLRASTPTTEQAIQVVEMPVLDPDTGELVLELSTRCPWRRTLPRRELHRQRSQPRGASDDGVLAAVQRSRDQQPYV
jgi:hypothetical protein